MYSLMGLGNCRDKEKASLSLILLIVGVGLALGLSIYSLPSAHQALLQTSRQQSAYQSAYYILGARTPLGYITRASHSLSQLTCLRLPLQQPMEMTPSQNVVASHSLDSVKRRRRSKI